MKKLFTICAVLLMTASVFAQSPEKMSYQAVIRNASNNLITNTQVGMQISILQGSTSGTAVYVETQEPTTNDNGLVSIEIGTGTSGDDFSAIDWANGPYFIKTETAVEAPLTMYTITGTSQLLSVPYALHAKTAETVTGSITETDPTYTSSQAANITATDITNLSNLSGVNTGDQTINRSGTTVTLSNGGGSFTDSVNVYTAGTGIEIIDNVISSKVYTTKDNIFYTIKDSIQITGPGTYIIDYGNNLRGSAWISCSIDQVISGIWNAGGTIIFSENDNTRDYLVNVAKYQYDGNQIQADLRPYRGSNTYAPVDFNGGKVEVNVTAISGQSWLRWSITVFPAN